MVVPELTGECCSTVDVVVLSLRLAVFPPPPSPSQLPPPPACSHRSTTNRHCLLLLSYFLWRVCPCDPTCVRVRACACVRAATG